MAHIDLRHAFEDRPDGKSDGGRNDLLELALRNLERTVRSDDRVCPYGASRIAITFGPDAEAITSRVLGERLARAVGRGLVGDRRVGPGGTNTVDRDETGGPPQPGNESCVSTAVVTVDRSLNGSALLTNRMQPSSPFPAGWPGVDPGLRFRTVIRCSGRRSGYGSRHDDRLPQNGPTPALGAVLVVEHDPTSATVPGLAALATRASAERLGFRTAVVPSRDGGELITEIDGVDLDLVVLMVGAGPSSTHPNWSSSSWCLPARLSSAYRSLGIEVLAVSAGAGAGALVGCLEQGAAVLFDQNALPDELLNMSLTGTLGAERTLERSRAGMPGHLQALLNLTSSERRVLYYLTTGRSAQEIADEIVVSLATVRSHIRSILRKLGVRSQLAAVALANSRGWAPAQPRRAS